MAERKGVIFLHCGTVSQRERILPKIYLSLFLTEEIQRRRLPEIPTSGGPREEDMYENASIDSPDLLREIQKEIPSVIVSTPLPSHSRPECEDVDGYLRPTFPEQPLPPQAPFSQQAPCQGKDTSEFYCYSNFT